MVKQALPLIRKVWNKTYLKVNKIEGDGEVEFQNKISISPIITS